MIWLSRKKIQIGSNVIKIGLNNLHQDQYYHKFIIAIRANKSRKQRFKCELLTVDYLT